MSRIAIVGDNSVTYIELLLNIWKQGDCAILIDWRIPARRVCEMLEEAEAQVCYVDNHVIRDKKLWKNKITHFIFLDFNRAVSEIPAILYEKYESDYSKNEALILYSSGTTGVSRGIILSYYAINTNADAILEYMLKRKEECILVLKSIAHSSTVVGEILVALKSGMRLIIGPAMVLPRVVFSNVMKYGVTILCVNPTLLRVLAKEYNLCGLHVHTLKDIYVSGDILIQNHLDKAVEAFEGINIYNVYGLTEAGPRVSAQQEGYHTKTSVGKPLRNVTVSIRDAMGKNVDEGQYGSIYVQSPSLYTGYVIGGTKFPHSEKGWLNTGDIGYILHGELFIIGRCDDVINVESHKIYPKDVEKIIIEQTGIDDCVVIGKNYRDSEVLICYYTATEEIEREQVNKLRECLATYEMPKKFVLVSELTKGIMGKKSYELFRRMNE